MDLAALSPALVIAKPLSFNPYPTAEWMRG